MRLKYFIKSVLEKFHFDKMVSDELKPKLDVMLKVVW